MAKRKMPKNRLCKTCGRIFASQGIGPHQKMSGHEGVEIIPVETYERDMTPVVMPPPQPYLNKDGSVNTVDKVQDRGVTFYPTSLTVIQDADGVLYLLERLER